MRSRGGLFLLMLSVLFAGTAARGASGTLQGLRTVVEADGTTFMLRLPTPVEFSPSQAGPTRYVVDIAGVSLDQPAASHELQSPLVSSYRLFSYKGVDQRPHIGLEIVLKQPAYVEPVQVADGLQIKVRGADAAAAAAPQTVPESRPSANSKKAGVVLREVSVVQPEGSSGLEVEIYGDGELTFNTMRLANPERLVVDLPNTINRIQQKELQVNTAPLRSVRIAQFRMNPPVSRIVMDLQSKVSFNVRRQANSIVVSLGSATPLSEKSAAPADSKSAVEAAEIAAPRIQLKATNKDMRQPVAPVAEQSALAAEPVLVASNAPIAPSSVASAIHLGATPIEAAGSASSNAQLTIPAGEKPGAQTAKQAASAGTAETFADRQAGVQLVAQQQSAPPSQTMLQAQQQGTGNYTGEPISMNLKDVDLKDFFRLMHEVSGLNIVLDPAVAGTVTIVLDDVPWDQAMDIVLKNNQLGKEVVGNVVRVAKLSTLKSEEDQRRELAAAIEQAQPRQTTTRTLSYAKAESLVTPLKRFLSPRGDLVPDPRTNTLIITDVPGVLPEIDRLIGALDRKTQQVEIEARIVAASRQFARDIGTQLAASGMSGNITLGGAGIVGESPIRRGVLPPLFIGTPPSDSSQFANISQPLATNFPAVGATSGFSFLLTAGSRFALDAIITAAERSGTGKILSRPKIITQNNVEAMVKQGVRIPIQTNINNTITTQYVDVVLRLTVTPQITAEGTVFLKTDVENTTIDPGIQLVSGIPALDTQQATTQVLVTDGGTVFFGGVIQTTNQLTQQQVPLLGSVPLVGNLFKRKFTNSQTNELLFFLTPKIVQS